MNLQKNERRFSQSGVVPGNVALNGYNIGVFTC
jgi:hypothetical protein